MSGDDAAVVDRKLDLAPFGADRHRNAMDLRLEDRLQLAAQPLGGECLERRAIGLADVRRTVLYLRFPFTSAELRSVCRFDRLDVLRAVLPHPKRKAVALQLVFSGIEIGRHQIALRPLTDLTAGNLRVRQCLQIAAGDAKF